VIGLMASLLIAAPATAQSSQWKWRDAQGQIQYSDRPPPLTVPAKDILQKPATVNRPVPPAAAASAAPAAAAASGASGASTVRTTDPELAARRRAAEAIEAAERKAAEDKLARERQESCVRARDYLRTLEAGMAIARVNAQGERIALGEAERRAEVSRAREVMASDCR
jgi:hypothetical protein